MHGYFVPARFHRVLDRDARAGLLRRRHGEPEDFALRHRLPRRSLRFKGTTTGFKTRYFVNPGELAWAAGVYPGQSPSATRKYNLRDAKSICLADCPQPTDDRRLGCVGCAITPPTVSIASQPNYDKTQWVADNYDYFQHLERRPKSVLRSTGRGRATPCSTRASTRSTLANSLVTAIAHGEADGKEQRLPSGSGGTTYRYESPFGASYASSGNPALGHVHQVARRRNRQGALWSARHGGTLHR